MPFLSRIVQEPSFSTCSQLQTLLNIPTICQRLFYESRELDDGNATVASLGLLANDILEFQEQNEIHEITDSGDEGGTGIKRDEGRGFGGTVLVGRPGSSRAADESTFDEQATVKESSLGNPPMDSEVKPCSACTFINPPDATFCDMCNTTLAVTVA